MKIDRHRTNKHGLRQTKTQKHKIAHH